MPYILKCKHCDCEITWQKCVNHLKEAHQMYCANIYDHYNNLGKIKREKKERFNYFKCNLCSQIIGKRRLLDHILSFHGWKKEEAIEKFFTPLSKEDAESENIVQPKHIKTEKRSKIKKKKEKKYQCIICEKIFESKSELKLHNNVAHKKGIDSSLYAFSGIYDGSSHKANSKLIYNGMETRRTKH